MVTSAETVPINIKTDLLIQVFRNQLCGYSINEEHTKLENTLVWVFIYGIQYSMWLYWILFFKRICAFLT